MQPRISVVLSTYNRDKLISRMLDSILSQTFKEFEVILINNGSTDNTKTICQQYVEKDKRIRLIKIEINEGAAKARNIGIDVANGDYIIMVDDDDYCEPKMFEHLYYMVHNYNADIAITGCVDEYDDGIYVKYQYDELYIWNKIEGVSEFLKREKFHTAPATKLFRKNLFGGLRWTTGTRIDDIHFIYKLFVEAEKVVAQAKPMYRFYKHSGNMTAFLSGDILKPDVLDDYLLMQDERVEHISNRIPQLNKQVRYARLSYMVSMVERIEEGYAEDCDKQLSYMKDYLRREKNEFFTSKWITEREKKIMENHVII